MRPVHTYIELVQCPLCRYTYMPVGDECCWRCAPPGAPPTYSELAAARRERQSSEMADGSVGSLAGLGFAPLGPPPVVFGAPHTLNVLSPSAAVPEPLPRERPADPWAIPRWAAIIGWALFMIHAVQAILRHHPLIGPR